MPYKAEDGVWKFTFIEDIRVWVAGKILGRKLWRWMQTQARERAGLEMEWPGEPPPF